MGLKTSVALLLLLAWFSGPVAGQPAAKSDDDLRREAAIADFTRRMKEANYPTLFQKAAQEFNVPADLLEAVAFAETRWEHLTWPPGETASPDSGMPRPYGIMSLWDNNYFGHSLLEAAKLLGQDPDELKRDPFQNIRGGAALLRKLYDENPKPEGSTEADVESWRYAIRKYCGIPEADLNARHALDVYTFMSQGYHQFGIEWAGRPVNLEPIREETLRIVQEEERKKQSRAATGSNIPERVPSLSQSAGTSAPIRMETGPSKTAAAPALASSDAIERRRIWWAIIAAVASIAAVLFYRKAKNAQN
jgi:hypothetical protein